MAETLKTIWVVERRTDVSEWSPHSMFNNRAAARKMCRNPPYGFGVPWTYRVAKYVRA